MKPPFHLLVLMSLGLCLAWCGEVESRAKEPASKKSTDGSTRMSRVSIRYMIDDVPAALKFYTTQLGFTVDIDASPAFASVTRDGVRLLLSGKASSGRRPLSDGRVPAPGGWNRIHIEVDDLAAEVSRLRAAGLEFRNETVTGPGGSQIILDDPSGNPIELFQPSEKQ